ncbi:molybdopterin-binding protein [Sulfitobacter aestuarii]|uniref:Molybdopterin-binding protein n=1 Tax=Sulfitobacter aestuarii TaxID=2161676 RepID=A0ABW5U2G6_9RHOB
MKFGGVPPDQALGAVLAHSLALPTGRLRKGRLLTAEDIAAISAAGHEEVVVARLDPGDVDENSAAAALAKALLAQQSGLRAAAPFTGRVNLIASGPGVALLDVAALEAVNLVHPMLTLATVAPFQQMAGGGMVATIKIISYAVPGEDLARACNAGRGAIALATPKLRRAALIITEIPGGAGEKGQQAIADRLQALGVTLDRMASVPHEPEALSRAIVTCDSELILILTGSATSDIDDVGPAALRAAGGRVERFGMPVDPGNLLFLGEVAGRQVIGLPGCARSPALNGVDWVLSRVICGVQVSSRDIAAMGVGGLLKEIPTRPQPRRGSAARS